MSEVPVLARGVWHPSGQLAELEAGTQDHLVWDGALASTWDKQGARAQASLLGVGTCGVPVGGPGPWEPWQGVGPHMSLGRVRVQGMEPFQRGGGEERGCFGSCCADLVDRALGPLEGNGSLGLSG